MRLTCDDGLDVVICRDYLEPVYVRDYLPGLPVAWPLDPCDVDATDPRGWQLDCEYPPAAPGIAWPTATELMWAGAGFMLAGLLASM
jgi:hypothetical protein